MKRTSFALICLFLVSTAKAETVCADHDDLVKLLNEKYGEQSIGFGLAGTKAIMEVFVSDKHTFTIIQTMRNGLSCIAAAGDNWEAQKPGKKI